MLVVHEVDLLHHSEAVVEDPQGLVQNRQLETVLPFVIFLCDDEFFMRFSSAVLEQNSDKALLRIVEDAGVNRLVSQKVFL